jgi:chemotaxis response regulator CheB
VSGTLQERSACNGSDLDSTRPASVLVSIAGSAGAFQGLWRLLSALPPDLNAAVAAMLHTGPGSHLPSTLAMRSRLALREAISGELL